MWLLWILLEFMGKSFVWRIALIFICGLVICIRYPFWRWIMEAVECRILLSWVAVLWLIINGEAISWRKIFQNVCRAHISIVVVIHDRTWSRKGALSYERDISGYILGFISIHRIAGEIIFLSIHFDLRDIDDSVGILLFIGGLGCLGQTRLMEVMPIVTNGEVDIRSVGT